MSQIAAAGLSTGLQYVLPTSATAETTVAQAVAGGYVDWWKSRRSANGECSAKPATSRLQCFYAGRCKLVQ